jgi:hypothetical protein
MFPRVELMTSTTLPDAAVEPIRNELSSAEKWVILFQHIPERQLFFCLKTALNDGYCTCGEYRFLFIFKK